jgi:redox-sensitive bicupin YhaK (pirin superfamily)
MMSAGTGVAHSEYNHSKSEPVHFLQIWIVPQLKGAAPRYQQLHFTAAEKSGVFRRIISPDGRDGSLAVHQDASVYAGLFDAGQSATFDVVQDRYAYVQVASGSVEMNGVALSAGDGVRVRDERALTFAKGEHAEVLVFDLRPNELPDF